MTTKTDITLPPLPRYMDSVTAEEFNRRVLAWGRAAVEADRQQRGEPAAWSAKSSKRRIERLRRWKRALGTAITHGLPKHARLDAEAAIQEMENAIKYDPPAASAEPADDDPLEGIDWQSPWTPEQVRSYPRAAAAALNRLLSEVYAAPVAAQDETELYRLRRALVYVAHALHGTPQYQLAEGIQLITLDNGSAVVRVSMDDWTVEASSAPDTAQATIKDSKTVQDREDAADMFWDADDPERFGGDNLHDTLVDLADDYGDPDFPVTVRLQCAKRLPDVQVVVTGRNDDGELVYEVIDAARAAKGE